jgi:hypothetical protein
LLSGCSGTAGFEGPDPLTGGPPIQRRTSPAPTLAAGLSPGASGGASGTPVAAGQLPPVPTPSTATSQAALAGGVSQPLDNSNLRIGRPTALTPDQPLWHSTAPAVPPGAGVVPASNPPPQPTPVVTPAVPLGIGVAPAPVPAAVPQGAAAPAGTLDDALRQLNAGRHVTCARLELLESGKWSFQCWIDNPAKPGAEFHYEFKEAASDLEAVRRVLDQIALEKH